MAATSHINRGFGLGPGDLATARELVSERLRADGIPLEVVQGGEISMARLEDLDDADLRALTLGGGPWLLLECPLSPYAPAMEPAVLELRAARARGPARPPGALAGPMRSTPARWSA